MWDRIYQGSFIVPKIVFLAMTQHPLILNGRPHLLPANWASMSTVWWKASPAWCSGKTGFCFPSGRSTINNMTAEMCFFAVLSCKHLGISTKDACVDVSCDCVSRRSNLRLPFDLIQGRRRLGLNGDACCSRREAAAGPLSQCNHGVFAYHL